MPPHERVIAVGGLQNYRDLGGYVTRDGKHVVMYKHIYRADNVSGITPEGKKLLLEKLKVKYIIDFRCAAEKSRTPSRVYADFLYFPIPIDACAVREEMLKYPSLNGDVAEQLIRRVAKTFLIDFKEEYKRFFDLLLNTAKGQPAAFHCTAGKDRTGMAAALLLTALDVPPATVMEDFLFTNQCSIPPSCETMKVGDCTITQDAINVLFRAQPYFLELAFNEVRKMYGSVSAYMEKELGLDKEHLRQLRSYYVRSKSS
jgi:protein-tyrosine phosphatase